MRGREELNLTFYNDGTCIRKRLMENKVDDDSRSGCSRLGVTIRMVS